MSCFTSPSWPLLMCFELPEAPTPSLPGCDEQEKARTAHCAWRRRPQLSRVCGATRTCTRARGTRRGAEPPPLSPASVTPPSELPSPNADGGGHGAHSAAGRARRVLGSQVRRARLGLKGVRQQSLVRGDGGRPRARGRVRRREKVGAGADKKQHGNYSRRWPSSKCSRHGGNRAGVGACGFWPPVSACMRKSAPYLCIKY